MSNKTIVTDAPLYMLDAFSQKAKHQSIYIEKLRNHLDSHKFISTPHKHDFFLLLYVSNGTGQHTIDFKTYDVTPGSFFLMSPGQVHSWQLSNNIEGWIIFFQPSFYRMGAIDHSLDEFPFFNVQSGNPLIQLSDDIGSLNSIIEWMDSEYHQKEVDLRLLRSYLDILLLKLSKQYRLEIREGADSNAFRVRKLELLVEQHYKKKKEPRQYAEMLNTSPSYLNSIVKKTIGKTLTDMISNRIVLEAKRLFSYSDRNVNQVSGQLGFTDTSYFIRFFKKHTGMTPEQFKQTVNRT